MTDFNINEYNAFWRFVYERQMIWYRRFVQNLPPPWTSDPILQRNKFTNIYRELDPGTQYAMKNILTADALRADIVFNIMLYRTMCSIPTYSGMGFQFLSEFNEQKFNDYLRDIYISGNPVFGNAYLISPYSSMGSTLKYENVSRLFGRLHWKFETFFLMLDSARTFSVAFEIIRREYGFGNFLAYQIMVDLTYPRKGYKTPVLDLSQNEWVRPGPGAVRGLTRIIGHKSMGEMQREIRLMWMQHHEAFLTLGLDFPYLQGDDGEAVPLSLPNIQNCLCEFHKYRSIQEGIGKSQRIYTP
jgi:hypothetical protein